MKTEEIEKLFHELKRSVDLGTITEREFQTEVKDLFLQDNEGNYWTIGARTEKWYRYEDGEWIQGSPPPTLEPVRQETKPPGVEQKPLPPGTKWDYGSRIILGLASLLFLLCLIVVALASYQLGRLSVMTGPMDDFPTAAVAITEVLGTETTLPSDIRTAVPSPPQQGGTATPLPTATQEVTSPTPAPMPTPSPTLAPEPTATPMPMPEMKYGPPVLAGPENGAQRGPAYEAILEWEPVGDLIDGEYYHVEVCWNDCDSPDDFHGHYLRATSYVFPSGIYRGRALDGKYYWHVTVRLQRADAPDGPLDPAISPQSETRVFLLPGE